VVFEAGTYASSLGLPLKSAVAQLRGPLTPQEAALLTAKLENDSQKLIYSSLLSVAAGLSGLERGYTTWPTVSLYYSCFYSVRALLALSNVCLYHDSNKPRWLESLSGKLPSNPPSKVRGSTHKLAFEIFSRLFPNSPLLSQPIDNLSPFDWLTTRREDANYNLARFIEPGESKYFPYLKKAGVRKLCVQYLQDNSLAFDPDHALVAYPLLVLKHISNMGPRGLSCILSQDEDKGYENYLADAFGPLRPLVELKRAVLR
jgi:hypothetical protein